MLYRRAADPKPTPHREPRRGGSVFHGAKSAPRPDVVAPAVTCSQCVDGSTLAIALAVETPPRGPHAAQGKLAGQARLRSPGTAPPLIHCPLPRRAGAVQRRQSSGARTRGRDDVGSERRVSAVTAKAKTGPQRVPSAAALIRPKRSRHLVAEPMLYRRPANPKPTPHREPRRGGSVFHGAKSAPRPDVVTTAVTWPLFDLHYTLHRHVKAADVGKLTTPVERHLPGLVGGNGAGVEALARGRRGVRIRIFVDPLHGVTGCDRQRRGREGCAFDRDGVRLRLSRGRRPDDAVGDAGIVLTKLAASAASTRANIA